MRATLNDVRPSLTAAALCLASVVFIGGCASPAQVRTAPGADVADYKTFNFVSPLGTDRAGYSSFLSSSLKSATRTALEAKGYAYSESDARMAVNFSGQAQQKTDVVPVAAPIAAGPFGFRAGLYGAWAGWTPMVDQYEQGTLMMDLVDVSKKELLWEGTTTIDKNDLSKWTDKDVQQVVQKIVAQIPNAN